jgi:hypothetical protein
MEMEIQNNDYTPVGLVPRAVALALAFLATGIVSVGTVALFAGADGAVPGEGSIATITASVTDRH